MLMGAASRAALPLQPRVVLFHRRLLSSVSSTPVNHFETLHLPETFRQSTDALQSALHDAQRTWHPDRYAGSPSEERELAARRSAEVNAAYSVLTAPDKRADHLLQVKGGGTVAESDGFEAGEEMLAWVMEMRERVESSGVGELNNMRQECWEGVRKCIARLESAFDVEQDLVLARNETTRLRYLQRIITAIEDKLPAEA